MEFLVLAIIPAAAVWSSFAATRVSLVTMAVIFLVATSCLPAEFFSVQGAGLSWTIDRALLLAMVVTFVIGLKRGMVRIKPFHAVDYLILLFLIWLSARTLTQPLGSVHKLQPHTLMHMINGYCVPFSLFFMLRSCRLESKNLKPAFWIIALVGAYLSITAVFEVTKLWSLVYPKYIADPTLSIHFGRARGPMLQSVRLGVCLLAGLTITFIYTIWLRPNWRSSWVLAAIMVPTLTLAIGLTYTRSVWMGLIAVVALVVVLCLQGTMRRAFVVGGGMVALLGVLIVGPNLVAFKREYSAAETRESTYMRAAFAYVSVEMMKDRPIAGYGFNQFNVANLTYLSDRSTDIRLESIRGYVHHNSYLSLLVDLGIVGFTLYGLVIAGCLRESWTVWRSTNLPRWAQGLGLTAICIASVHLIQMAFHEVSFSSIENGVLFAGFGLVCAAKRQFLSKQFDAADHDGLSTQ